MEHATGRKHLNVCFLMRGRKGSVMAVVGLSTVGLVYRALRRHASTRNAERLLDEPYCVCVEANQ